MNGLMAGKRGLIMGLANDKSLAWGIAQKLSEAGAELAFSYQGECLAGLNCEAHIVHRLEQGLVAAKQRPAAQGEMLAEVADFEQRLAGRERRNDFSRAHGRTPGL